MPPRTDDENAALKAENARLIALPEAHGIEWRLAPAPLSAMPPEPEPSRLSTTEKMALFRRLFQGRTDVYPLLADGACRFLAVDFDEAEWQDDALAFVHSCRDLGIPVALTDRAAVTLGIAARTDAFDHVVPLTVRHRG